MSSRGFGGRGFGTSTRGSANAPRATSSTLCQKCLKTGHYLYECPNKRPYSSRPSRTQMLENPKLAKKAVPSVEVPEEFKQKKGVADKILQDKEKERELGKKRKRSASASSSGSSSSDSDSSSSSDSSLSSSSDSRSSGSSRSRSRSSRSRSPPRKRNTDAKGSDDIEQPSTRGRKTSRRTSPTRSDSRSLSI